MAELIFSVVCRRVLRDQPTQLLSLIDIVERIAVKIPADADMSNILFHEDFQHVSLIRKGEASGNDFFLKISGKGPDGKAFFSDITHSFTWDKAPQVRNLTSISGINFSAGTGRYTFFTHGRETADGKWRPLGKYGIDVLIDLEKAAQ
jgi:hypothetical protein